MSLAVAEIAVWHEQVSSAPRQQCELVQLTEIAAAMITMTTAKMQCHGKSSLQKLGTLKQTFLTLYMVSWLNTTAVLVTSFTHWAS